MTTLPENIKWRNSIAREILLSDLEDGILSTDEKDLSAEEAWEKFYRHFYEFRKVPFEQFKTKIKDHRNQVQRMINTSAEDELALAHDRGLHPRKRTITVESQSLTCHQQSCSSVRTSRTNCIL
jgi:hypothetical protein